MAEIFVRNISHQNNVPAGVFGTIRFSIPGKDEKNSRRTKRSQWNRPVPHQYPGILYAGMISDRENTG
jgi:hypothetical protein